MIGTTGALSLPPQMLSLKEKNEQWQHDCMDALESIGRHQYYNNSKLIENYEMVRGRFIYSHYIEREDYADMLDQLTREFDMPSHLRHYDIISQVINTLSGEYQKRPDLFRAEAHDERAQNNYTRQKSEMLIEYVMEGINNAINQRLVKEGLDPARKDFSSEEEQQQYQQQVAQRQKALSPPEIERYMQTNWMDAAEIWAENQLELDKRRFNLKEKEKIEFEDMLISDRCFRHFYLVPDGYSQETWNPIHTFYHKSPEVLHIEDGDYVGRVFFMSIPEIVNRYGHMMTEDQLQQLEEFRHESYKARTGGDSELGWAGIPAGVQMPYEGYQNQHFTQSHLGFDPNNPETINYNIEQALGTQVGNTPSTNPYTLFQVTEAYWMSQRRLGKLVYADETGQPVTMIVDETVKIPGIKEIKNSFMELGNDERINTITWTWVNQVYKGLKINNQFVNMKKPIYLNVGPNDFQFKGDQNIYGAKLPVCGQVFNNRNADSMSLVDMMKPHQIGYNVAMNQLYEIMQREVGRFMLMDMNFIPSGKDWGGERNYERLMLVAKSLGIAPLDGSPTNVKGSPFSHFQMIDLDESARMMSRLKIAEAFEAFALKQVGITPQRLGSIAASESATGVQQAVNQSYAQTESYFTNYSHYKARCLQMGLEMAQYVESQRDNIKMMYIKSDMSRAFIEIAGTDLLMSELGVYVSDSAEAARQLETLRQLFMNSNTTGATPVDLATVITSNSPAEIKAQLKASYEALQKKEQSQFESQQQAEQQKMQMAQEMADKARAFEAEQKELDRANERYVAEIKAMGTATINNSPDQDGNGIPDVLEIQKFNLEIGKHSEDILFKKQQELNKQQESHQKMKLEQERTKVMKAQQEQEQSQHEDNVRLKEKEIESKEKIAKSKPKPKS